MKRCVRVSWSCIGTDTEGPNLLSAAQTSFEAPRQKELCTDKNEPWTVFLPGFSWQCLAQGSQGWRLSPDPFPPLYGIEMRATRGVKRNVRQDKIGDGALVLWTVNQQPNWIKTRKQKAATMRKPKKATETIFWEEMHTLRKKKKLRSEVETLSDEKMQKPKRQKPFLMTNGVAQKAKGHPLRWEMQEPKKQKLFPMRKASAQNTENRRKPSLLTTAESPKPYLMRTARAQKQKAGRKYS